MKFILPLLIIFFNSKAFSQTNLITNGGLEQWSNASTLTNWTTINSVTRNTTDVVEGNYSALFSHINGSSPMIQTQVPLIKNVQYKIEFSFKFIGNNYGGTHPITFQIRKTGSATALTSSSFALNNNWRQDITNFTPDVTGNYDFSIYLFSFDNESFNVVIDNIKIYPVTPIPVELINFSTKPLYDLVQLDWKTATEINTLGFEIQRSLDGKIWSKLDFIDAKNRPADYQYLDQSPYFNQVNYYRLCTVSIDGKKDFSKTCSVKFGNSNKPIKIYPSKTEGIINIDALSNIQEVLISDMNGKIILKSTQTKIDLSTLSSGIYIVSVKMSNSIFSEMIFKQ